MQCLIPEHDGPTQTAQNPNEAARVPATPLTAAEGLSVQGPGVYGLGPDTKANKGRHTYMCICVYVCSSVLLSIRPFSEHLLRVPVVKAGAGWWPQQTQSQLTLTVHREPHRSFSMAGLPHMSLNRGGAQKGPVITASPASEKGLLGSLQSSWARGPGSAQARCPLYPCLFTSPSLCCQHSTLQADMGLLLQAK